MGGHIRIVAISIPTRKTPNHRRRSSSRFRREKWRNGQLPNHEANRNTSFPLYGPIPLCRVIQVLNPPLTSAAMFVIARAINPIHAAKSAATITPVGNRSSVHSSGTGSSTCSVSIGSHPPKLRDRRSQHVGDEEEDPAEEHGNARGRPRLRVGDNVLSVPPQDECGDDEHRQREEGDELLELEEDRVDL